MSNNIKRKIIALKAPSNLDDLLCDDGEVLGGDWLFPSPPAQSDGDASPPATPEISSPTLPTSGQPEMRLPEDAFPLLAHRVDPDVWNLIYKDADGNVYFCSFGSSSPNLIVGAETVGLVSEVVDVGKYVVFLTDKGLMFASWESGSYNWLGTPPEAPAFNVTRIAKALPPYSYVDGDLPEMVVEIQADDSEAELMRGWLDATAPERCPAELKSRLKKAIVSAVIAFVDRIAEAGLFFQSLYISAAWAKGDVYWNYSIPILSDAVDSLKLRVKGVAHSAGVFSVRLALSQSPFALAVSNSLSSLPEAWKNLINQVVVFVSKEYSRFNFNGLTDALFLTTSTRGFEMPLTAPLSFDSKKIEFTELGAVGSSLSTTTFYAPKGEVCFRQLNFLSLPSKTPDFVRNINSSLVAVWNGNIVTPENSMMVSEPFMPFAISNATTIGGERVLNVTHSLRPLSSGQLGQFPLYAFSADGIRALTPKDGGYVDVQLISRDVAISDAAFAPLPSGTAFISNRGVMEIEGTTVKCISDKLNAQAGRDHKFSDCDRLAYDYATDSLILYNAEEQEAFLQKHDSSVWYALDWCPAAHCYLWPDLLLMLGNNLCKLKIVNPDENESLRVSTVLNGMQTLILRTRPIKLGDPFLFKKLKKVTVIWPDGNDFPFQIYGSSKLGIWHLLGRSRGNSIRLEGSSWRFFKIEIPVISPPSYEYSDIIAIPKPLIMFEFVENSG